MEYGALPRPVEKARTSWARVTRCGDPRGAAGVAVVVADDVEAGRGEPDAEVVVPPDHRPAEAHHQQQRVAVDRAEGLVADLHLGADRGEHLLGNHHCRRVLGGASRRAGHVSSQHDRPSARRSGSGTETVEMRARIGLSRTRFGSCDSDHTRGFPVAGRLRPPARARRHRRGPSDRRGRPLRLGGDEPARRTPPHAVRHRERRCATTSPCCWCRASWPATARSALMRRALQQQGLRTYRSHIRANVGCTLDVAAQMEMRLESIAQRRGSKVRIVGHSLGGMLARGVAARRPDLVSGLVTMGSPMLAPGAHHVSLSASVAMLVRLSRAGFPGRDVGGLRRRRVCAPELRRGPRPAWRTRSTSPRSTPSATASSTGAPASTRWPIPVEVRASHVGMALDPRVIAAVIAGACGRAVVSGRSRSRRNRVASRAGARC